jgi:hypothetical protein
LDNHAGVAAEQVPIIEDHEVRSDYHGGRVVRVRQIDYGDRRRSGDIGVGRDKGNVQLSGAAHLPIARLPEHIGELDV